MVSGDSYIPILAPFTRPETAVEFLSFITWKGHARTDDYSARRAWPRRIARWPDSAVRADGFLHGGSDARRELSLTCLDREHGNSLTNVCGRRTGSGNEARTLRIAMDDRFSRSVQSRTRVLLTFVLRLPSVEALGRWRERGRMDRRCCERSAQACATSFRAYAEDCDASTTFGNYFLTEFRRLGGSTRDWPEHAVTVLDQADRRQSLRH